jgi:stalled ribosome rescue protein Dom34
MTYRHAIVWLDHREATVIDYSFDDRHVVQVVNEHAPHKIHRKSGVPGTGREGDDKEFFDEIVRALGTAEEVVVTGPGTAKHDFRHHVEAKHAKLGERIVGFETLDHPSHGQLLDFAKQYFRRIDALRGDV